MRKVVFSLASAAALAALSLAAAPAQAQSFSEIYARSQGQGLMYDGQEIRRTAGVTTTLAMSGHKLDIQEDGNVCIYTAAHAWRWCINDQIGDKYQQTAKVTFQKGVLSVLDASGVKLWSTRSVADPYAKLLITPEGKLQTVSAVGALYWQNP